MIKQFIKPYIQELVPYSTARDEYSGDASVFLDANENPFPTAVNRYPDPHHAEVKGLVSTLRGVPVENIFVGNGSDEAIDLLVRVSTCEHGGVTITPPTYGMYKVAALSNGAPILEAPLHRDFSLDSDAIASASASGSALLFLCSPNNPTGTYYSLDEIRRVTEVFAGIVVVDEAYIDFADGPSATSLLTTCDRLVVLQTLSKAWGMAGIRVGMAFAAPELVMAMNRIKLPYNINTLSQRYAIERLREPERVRQEIRTITSERQRMGRELSRLSVVQRVFPSEANFLLVQVRDAQRTCEHLRQRGIIVRDRSRELHCAGCVRITVGTTAENDAVLEALREELV